MTAMWNHYCLSEKTKIATGDDEPCNWCGAEAAHVLIAYFKKLSSHAVAKPGTQEITP